MNVAAFSTKPHDRVFLDAANAAAGSPHKISYFETHLDASTAALTANAAAVCPFVNDQANREVLLRLAG